MRTRSSTPRPPIWTGTWRDPRFSPPKTAGSPRTGSTGTIFTVNWHRPDWTRHPGAGRGRARCASGAIPASQTCNPAGGQPRAECMLGYEWDVDADNGFRPAGLIATVADNAKRSGSAARLRGYRRLRPGDAPHDALSRCATAPSVQLGQPAMVLGTGWESRRERHRRPTRRWSRRPSTCSPTWGSSRQRSSPG